MKSWSELEKMISGRNLILYIKSYINQVSITLFQGSDPRRKLASYQLSVEATDKLLLHRGLSHFQTVQLQKNLHNLMEKKLLTLV